MQRRLSTSEIHALVALYRDGSSIDALARGYRVHRTTVISQLDQAGVARRRVVRKMTDESVVLAATRYEQGASLALVASEFAVHQRTLARELRRDHSARVIIRGHALMQNIRRGHYELGRDARAYWRIEAAFTELARTI